MIAVRSFTDDGVRAFKDWLTNAALGEEPRHLLSEPGYTTELEGGLIDPTRQFDSRFDFGTYLVRTFSELDADKLLAPSADGVWTWLCAIYFGQLTSKGIRRYEHYVATRRGTAGDLLHRNAARTAFELVLIHGTNARLTLRQPMHTHGQLLESLSASQSIARNKGFFAAAALMYLRADGKLKSGATSKPKKPRERKLGDESGKGSIRRLPTALKRLDLTYDVEMLSPQQLIVMLPVEYTRWLSS